MHVIHSVLKIKRETNCLPGVHSRNYAYKLELIQWRINAISMSNTLVLNNNIRISLGIYLYQHTDIKMHYGLAVMWFICFKPRTLKAIWKRII